MTRILVLAVVLGFGLGAASAYAEEGRRGDRQTFEELDADGDGSISREEFTASKQDRAAKRFDRADADSDGVLSEEEYASAKGRRGGRGGRRH